jgi:hypothetical protein
MEKTAHDLPPPLEAEPVQLRGGGTIIRVKRKRNEQPLDALGMNPSPHLSSDCDWRQNA